MVMAVKKGDKVSVEYEGKFETGEVFDSSSHGDHSHPLEFQVGSGQVIKGFDDAVTGMNLNQEKEIKIAPEEAYGVQDPNLMREVPRNVLPQDQKPQEDMTLVMKTKDGQQLQARIAKVTKDTVTLDMNHPLAGKTLIFKIKLVKIN